MGCILQLHYPSWAKMHFISRSILILAASLGATFVAAQQVLEVTIRDYTYDPPRLTVRRGDTVRWLNQEKRTSHSIYLTGAGAFESPRIFPGESWSHTFTEPGEQVYRCGPHPEMEGRVMVTE